MIKSGLDDWKNEIEDMTSWGTRQDSRYCWMNSWVYDLNQRGQELKIVTPDQMLSRYPITLVQLKAGNNSETLKNKIRQLL